MGQYLYQDLNHLNFGLHFPMEMISHFCNFWYGNIWIFLNPLFLTINLQVTTSRSIWNAPFPFKFYIRFNFKIQNKTKSILIQNLSSSSSISLISSKTTGDGQLAEAKDVVKIFDNIDE